MKVLENIAADLEKRIADASFVNTSRPTISFCSCDAFIKKDIHKRAKRIGFTPFTQSNTLLLTLNYRI